MITIKNTVNQQKYRIPIIDAYSIIDGIVKETSAIYQKMAQLLRDSAEKLSLNIKITENEHFFLSNKIYYNIFDMIDFLAFPIEVSNISSIHDAIPFKNVSKNQLYCILSRSIFLIRLSMDKHVDILIDSYRKEMQPSGVLIEKLSLLENQKLFEFLKKQKVIVYIKIKKEADLKSLSECISRLVKTTGNPIVLVLVEEISENLIFQIVSSSNNIFLVLPSFSYSLSKKIISIFLSSGLINRLLFATYFPNSEISEVTKTLLLVLSLTSKDMAATFKILYHNALTLYFKIIPLQSVFYKRKYVKLKNCLSSQILFTKLLRYIILNVTLLNKKILPISKGDMGREALYISVLSSQGWGHFLITTTHNYIAMFCLTEREVETIMKRLHKIDRYFEFITSVKETHDMFGAIEWFSESLSELGYFSLEDIIMSIGYKVRISESETNFIRLSKKDMNLYKLKPLDAIIMKQPSQNKIIPGLVVEEPTCSEGSILISRNIAELFEIDEGTYLLIKKYERPIEPAEKVLIAFDPMYHPNLSMAPQLSNDKKRKLLLALREKLANLLIMPRQKIKLLVNSNIFKIIITSINDKRGNYIFSLTPELLKKIDVIPTAQEIPLNICVTLESSILMQKKDVQPGDILEYLPSKNIDFIERRVAAIVILSVILTNLFERFRSINNLSLITFDKEVDVVKVKRSDGELTHLIPIKENRDIKLKLFQNLVSIKTQLLREYPDYYTLFEEIKHLFSGTKNPAFFILLISGIYSFGNNPIPKFHELVKEIHNGYFLIITLGDDVNEEFIRSLIINERIKHIHISNINLIHLKDGLYELIKELIKRNV